MLLHNLQELDNHLRTGPDHDLALSSLLGVVDGLERIVEDGCFYHDCDRIGLRFSRRGCGVRYLHCHTVSLQEPYELRVPFRRVLQLGRSLRSSVIAVLNNEC